MADYQFSDSHIHLTKSIQEGPDIRDLLAMMRTTIKRSALSGVPAWERANVA